MLRKVRTYIETHHLLGEGARVLVALSGGADSVCLVHVLKDLGYEVVAAHCNFHLRGDESMRDEAFVRGLCEQMQVPLEVKDFPTQAYAAAHGVSIEMAARELRYAWFEELRKERKCEAICVAHHMNDQAETLLLNLQRGTGFRGLEGMKPRNGQVVRPLLRVTRKEIEEYCRAQGYDYVTDSTNADTSIKRNGLRALLGESTEAEIAHMAHTAELMQAYDGLLEALLLGTSVPKESERALLYELLAPYGFNATQVENILSALPSSGKRFETPDFEAVVDHGELRVVSKEALAEETEPMVLRAVRPRMTKEHYPAATEQVALFDAERLPERLLLRHWTEGDAFYPICNSGRAQRKKLQDLFSDAKLSVAEKNRVWLLCNQDRPEEIVWVVGHRIGDEYKITDSTKLVAEVELEG